MKLKTLNRQSTMTSAEMTKYVSFKSIESNFDDPANPVTRRDDLTSRWRYDPAAQVYRLVSIQ